MCEKHSLHKPDRQRLSGWPSQCGAQQGRGMLRTTKQDHQAERLQAIRLRYSINTHLEDCGITTPASIGTATGLPAPEAVRLLTRRQWREGDVTALEAIAERLCLEVLLDLRLRATQRGAPKRGDTRCRSPAATCRADRR